MRRTVLIAALALLSVCVGCRSQQPSPYSDYRTAPADLKRDTEAARKRNAAAVGFLRDGKLDKAEKELKAALGADLFFGPAHNNLGIVYQRRGEYYLAAWEFQYAARLMARKAEPRNNLGLVYETVGRLDESAKWYDEAMGIDSENTEVAGNLARVLVKNGKDKERVRQLLDEIILKDPRPDWVAWAKEERAMMGRSSEDISGEEPSGEKAAPADEDLQ